VNRLLWTVLALGLVACGKRETRFESVCQLIRRDVVEVNEQGAAQLVDVELEWDPCPGDQFQVVRGGKEFAACMERYQPGDFVPVRVSQWWDDRGYYRWDVYRVGECQRSVEPDTEGSYEKSQECNDNESYGHKTGFLCSRLPFRKLVSVCPWMARR
jgi:hypothetical protein